MLKVKIKSFEDAVQAAIENGKEDDVFISDDKNLRRFDSVFGINRNWTKWGRVISAWEAEPDVVDGVEYHYYYNGEFYIPYYCIEYATED